MDYSTFVKDENVQWKILNDWVGAKDHYTLALIYKLRSCYAHILKNPMIFIGLNSIQITFAFRTGGNP